MSLRRILPAAAAALCLLAAAQTPAPKRPRRTVTPVETTATSTQAVNETRGDTSRINAAIRARSTHYHRDDGFTVYVDTLTGDEWVDSTQVMSLPKMKFPLVMGVNVGVDIWDPAMRLFGQKYGLTGFTADVNLHNRYFPTFELGLGMARRTPAGQNYTYRSPLSVYFKIGADYNFLYNSNPDYKWFVGLRYGFSPFTWAVDDITLDDPYWGSSARFGIPSQTATAGWGELCMGLRIRLWGNIHAGWMVRFHALLHQSKSPHGEPWYIPGFGARGQALTGSFTISYTIPVNKRRVEDILREIDGADAPLPAPADTTAAPADTAATAEPMP
ncbi:MAG: DUF6048 family protein [Bacteroides sp.]|nr:DUF6048 family protein [Bacteroides sp.]MCM1096356.1 DUF6048 family protein [Terasakiella sp.]